MKYYAAVKERGSASIGNEHYQKYIMVRQNHGIKMCVVKNKVYNEEYD